MALLDSADLLDRTKRLANRPATDEDMTDAHWYAFLTDAQSYVLGQVAWVAPHWNLGAPTAITSSDGGYTYTLPAEPVGMVVLTDGNGGRTLRSGSYRDVDAEYVLEGTTVRMARHVARSFSNGLYVQMTSVAGVIDGSTAPTLKPTRARFLLPPYACYLYALRNKGLDPNGYLSMYQKLWSGDPAMAGDYGLVGELRQQASGVYAHAGESGKWWRATGDI